MDVFIVWFYAIMMIIVYSAGFDLVDVGKEEITVKSGKQANRRCLSFALQALVAVFSE